MSFGEGNLRDRVEQLERENTKLKGIIEEQNAALGITARQNGKTPMIVKALERVEYLESELADKTAFIDHQEREIAELEFEAKYNRRRIEELNSELVQQIKLISLMWNEICTCPEYRDPPCMTDEICGLMRELGFGQIIAQRNEEP